jgi:hypothetical protein
MTTKNSVLLMKWKAILPINGFNFVLVNIAVAVLEAWKENPRSHFPRPAQKKMELNLAI